MSDPTTYATSIFAADGSTTDWTFSFSGVSPDSDARPYLEEDDIKTVIIAEDLDSGIRVETPVVRTVIAPNQVRITPAVTEFDESDRKQYVKIYRDSNIAYSEVDFLDGTNVTERDLDQSNRQLIFVMQETVDRTTEAISSIETLLQAGPVSQAQLDEEQAARISGDSANSAAISGLATATASSISTLNTNVTALSAAIASLSLTVDGKQDQLVSGTNIKTVNGESILGTGDLTITAAQYAGYTTVTVSTTSANLPTVLADLAKYQGNTVDITITDTSLTNDVDIALPNFTNIILTGSQSSGTTKTVRVSGNRCEVRGTWYVNNYLVDCVASPRAAIGSVSATIVAAGTISLAGVSVFSLTTTRGSFTRCFFGTLSASVGSFSLLSETRVTTLVVTDGTSNISAWGHGVALSLVQFTATRSIGIGFGSNGEATLATIGALSVNTGVTVTTALFLGVNQGSRVALQTAPAVSGTITNLSNVTKNTTTGYGTLTAP